MARTLVWERVAHHSHLYVLPAAGAASVTLGALTLAGQSWDPTLILPSALVVVGAAAVAGSLGSYLCLPPRSEAKELTPNPRPARSAIESVAPAHAKTELPRSETTTPPEPRPSSGIGRATLAHLTQVEDELWRRWASPQNVPLGAPLVGPVAATAYSPRKSGAFNPFPKRDEDIVRLPASAATPTQARSPSKAPEPVAVPRPPTPRADAPRPSAFGIGTPLAAGRAGELFSLDAFDHPAYLESVNPILPRLRPSTAVAGPASRSGGVAEAPKPSPIRTGFCSECSRRLVDFRSWVECRICRQPLCDQCLQESFQEDDVGACAECRVTRRWSPNRGRPAGVDRSVVAGAFSV